jgi:hypothetical protein
VERQGIFADGAFGEIELFKVLPPSVSRQLFAGLFNLGS